MPRHPSSAVALAVIVALALLLTSCGDDAPEALGAGTTDPTPAEGATSVVTEGEVPTPSATAVVPTDGGCNAVSAENLLAGPVPTLDELRGQLPLMRGDLREDTKLVWEQFGSQPDHLIVDGLPRMLIAIGDYGSGALSAAGIDDASDAAEALCDQIRAAVNRPDLVVFVSWTEEAYFIAFQRGGLPPWRRLIEDDVSFDPTGDNSNAIWTSIGTGAYGVTSVSLRNDQEALAATLAETYGPLIELSVGNFPYPQDPNGPSADNRCAALPAGEPPPDLEVVDVTVEGDQGASTVSATLANTGQATLHLVPWRVAELTALDSNQLVSAFDGSQTTDDRGSIVLEPGSQTTITAIASTASCDPEVGFELPPGNYEFVLPIYVFDAPASENDTSTTVLIPRIEYAIG